MRVPDGEVRNRSICEPFGCVIDTVAVTFRRRAPSPLTSIVDASPATSLSLMLPPSPWKSTVAAAGGNDDSVLIVNDQPCRIPVEPPESSTTTSAHGPAAGSPTRADSAPSGCTGPVATAFVYVRFRTLGALGV